MKLRNKKTGEIIILIDHIFDNYKNLDEFKAEWEDYEEPKTFFTIYYDGTISEFRDGDDEQIRDMKEIGNYFETKEEAEKAVEKLKAWKRLKDKGFRFTDDLVYGEYYGCGSIRFIIFPSKEEKYVKDDLELLFSEAKNE